MLKKIGRILLIVFAVLVVIVTLAVVFGPPWTRRTAEESFPQIDGEIQLAGLDGPVDVYRDDFGVPHIYAATQHDLFFAQGYVHAQDRFWQMDFWRHQGAGRLSELLGSVMLETDQFLRTLGWERVALAELESADPELRAALESYAEGVNAYLTDHIGTAIALEYAFLPILNRGYEPVPWTPLNTMTWAKAMSWDLGGNMRSEVSRAILLKTFTPEQIDQLYPAYSFGDRPVIVPHPHITTGGPSAPDDLAALAAVVSPALTDAGRQIAALNALTGGGSEGIGSNSWAISGDLTDTGMPLLANDMHLGAQLPSIWYEIGLHCLGCGIDVTGVSFAGSPGVVVGHNERIAWGFTNVGPDVQDLYIEKINPDNPNQYEFQGEWVDMEIVVEQINVAGGDPVEQTVRVTRHGPIITEVYGLEEFSDEAGIDLPEHFAISLRWTALEPTCTFCAIFDFNTAQNWDEFRSAAAKFEVPAQNLVYADVDGNIGYQMPGAIPIRAEGHNGLLPVPGWTGEYEWQGYIPFDELPFAFNPPEGYIVTANNAVVGSEYPYTISRNWAYGERAQRIVDMIEHAPGTISAAYIQEMHGDNMDITADSLVQVLLQISLDDQDLENARSIFEGWDYQMDMDSAPAALFAVFWKHLNSATLDDDYPEDDPPDGGRPTREFMRQFVEQPNSPWWDDQTTPEVEARDDIFRQAFEAAVKEMRKIGGQDPAGWVWGDMHTITFENQVMSSFPFISKAFNRGPFCTSGSGGIINATGWSTRESYEVFWMPSMRMIVDLSALQASWMMHTTGQSGHPYHPHYIDMADPWRLIEYHQMHWERAAIEADAEGHLRLVP
ncbi:MAG: penicillin acylase family protein [Chloroflexi bacterium]|nr:penicillin acylase family protein [Chloroflexota bacterium]